MEFFSLYMRQYFIKDSGGMSKGLRAATSRSWESMVSYCETVLLPLLLLLSQEVY